MLTDTRPIFNCLGIEAPTDVAPVFFRLLLRITRCLGGGHCSYHSYKVTFQSDLISTFCPAASMVMVRLVVTRVGQTHEMVSRQPRRYIICRSLPDAVYWSESWCPTQNGPWASEPSSPLDWGTRTSWPGAPLGESPSLGQSCPIGSGQALASYVSTDGSLKCGFAQRKIWSSCMALPFTADYVLLFFHTLYLILCKVRRIL